MLGDFLTILIAAVANVAIGCVWYSKGLFGSFLEGSGKKLTEIKKSFLFGFCNSLVIAYFLSFFFACLEISNVTDGMLLGFLFWLGFVATTEISPVIWGYKSLKMFCLHTGCRLISFLVMGGILGA